MQADRTFIATGGTSDPLVQAIDLIGNPVLALELGPSFRFIVRALNARLRNLLDRDVADFIGRPLDRMFSRATARRLDAIGQQCIAHDAPLDVRFCLARAVGGISTRSRWQMTVSPVAGSNPKRVIISAFEVMAGSAVAPRFEDLPTSGTWRLELPTSAAHAAPFSGAGELAEDAVAFKGPPAAKPEPGMAGDDNDGMAMDLRFEGTDGSLRHLRAFASRAQSDRDGTRVVGGRFFDITPIALAAGQSGVEGQAASDSESRGDAMLLALDGRGRVSWVSDPCLKALRFERHEIDDRPLATFLTPSSGLELECQLADPAVERISDLELRFVRKDKRLVDFRVVLAVDRDEDGALRGAGAILHETASFGVWDFGTWANTAPDEHSRLSEFMDGANGWLWELDADLRIAAICGQRASDDEPGMLIGRQPWDAARFSPAENPRWRDYETTLRRREAFRSVLVEERRADGRLVWRLDSGKPLFAEDGRFLGYRGVSWDITRQRTVELEALVAQQQLNDSIECLDDALVLFDHDGRMVTSNDRFRQLYESVLGRLDRDWRLVDFLGEGVRSGFFTLHDDDPERWLAAQLRHYASIEAKCEFEIDAGRIIEVRTRRTAHGGQVAVYRDITLQRQAEMTLRHAANHDPLTGLANRRRFEEGLRQAVELANRRHARFALMLLDLDGFKAVNDRFGHPAGDALLQTAAMRIRHCVKASDIVTRIGGDEFAVIIGELIDNAIVFELAEQIHEAVNHPMWLGEHRIRISVSIGIGFFPDTDRDVDRLVSSVDAALYRAKAATDKSKARDSIACAIPSSGEGAPASVFLGPRPEQATTGAQPLGMSLRVGSGGG